MALGEEPKEQNNDDASYVAEISEEVVPAFTLVVYEPNEDECWNEDTVEGVEEIIGPPTHNVREHPKNHDAEDKRELVLQPEEGRRVRVRREQSDPPA
eukprot:CAMPEP_0170485188 /NCGR_PEP_ID=MMETSP0208-20121228/4506_1 /TAXON_ID=197538 /ORGANISM="Strombidium inclinatum, Strain S3" /LENGTH=97 /DNA_ID=CAMNT_0010758757 /DNA_START=72 /DNA_END=365 /DNA_ORIENTATION=+